MCRRFAIVTVVSRDVRADSVSVVLRPSWAERFGVPDARGTRGLLPELAQMKLAGGGPAERQLAARW